MNHISQDLSEGGWKQGAILDQELTRALIENHELHSLPEITEKDLIIVISHDCDLLHRCLDTEPFCELILAKFVENSDPAKRHGKSTRYFQFEHSPGFWYECFASHKVNVDRSSLTGHQSIGQLTKENKNRLLYWIANRYNRAAFPNAFEKRISSKKKRIEKFLKNSEFITDIYFKLTDENELDDTVKYKLLGYAVMKDADFIVPSKRDLSMNVLEGITEVFNQVGIEFLEPFSLVSDDLFSIASVRRLKPWNKDWISFDEGDEERTERNQL